MLSRRNMFAAVPAAVAFAAVPMSALSSDGRHLLEMERECDRCWEMADHPALDDEATEVWVRKASALEVKISEAPATSRDAVLVKLRLLRRFREYDRDVAGVNAVNQIIAFIEGAH